MAAVTLAIDTLSDANATTYASGAFTPAAGDLLVVVSEVSGSIDAAPTCTSSVGGKTYSFSNLQQQAATHQTMVFIADQLATAVSQTATVSVAADAGTACIVTVLRVSGMTKTGLTARMQWATPGSGSASVTPTVVFGAAVNTNNPVVVALRCSTAALAVTPPTNYTEHTDSATTTPVGSQETATRDSGETGTTITWGGLASTAWISIGIELDASAAFVPYRNPMPQLLAH